MTPFQMSISGIQGQCTCVCTCPYLRIPWIVKLSHLSNLTKVFLSMNRLTPVIAFTAAVLCSTFIHLMHSLKFSYLMANRYCHLTSKTHCCSTSHFCLHFIRTEEYVDLELTKRVARKWTLLSLRCCSY